MQPCIKTFSRPQTFCDFSMTQIKSGDLLQPLSGRG